MGKNLECISPLWVPCVILLFETEAYLLKPAVINRQRWDLNRERRRCRNGVNRIALSSRLPLLWASSCAGMCRAEAQWSWVSGAVNCGRFLVSVLRFWRWWLLGAFWVSGRQDPSETPWLSHSEKQGSWYPALLYKTSPQMGASLTRRW